MLLPRGYPKYKPEKNIEKEWGSFRRGLNTLLRDVELKDEELKEAGNVFIEGKGIITPRPGSGKYFQVSTNSVRVRALYGIESMSGTNELLALSDEGFLTKKSGASHTIITGASFASGYDRELVQIRNNIYIVGEDKAMTKYDFSSLIEYTGISRPTNLTATKSSSASGTFTYSWRVSAESQVGETLASDAVQLATLPETLSSSDYVTLSWGAVSAASGMLKGYVIYGREPGDETFMTRVSDDVTTWLDDGTSVPSDIAYLPDEDSTQGYKAKYVITHKDKLILANIKNYPSRVVWSGGGPHVDRFHWGVGGGSVDINKDDGQEITGIVQSAEGSIIVFKDRSIYQLSLSYNSSLGIVEPTVTRISGAIGCVSHRSIRIVENAIFFAGRRAGGGVSLNSLDYEPNILSATLRTAEISARIRPTLDGVNAARFSEITAEYYDGRYYWFLPIGGSTISCIVYDRERLAFTGFHTFADNVATPHVHYDSSSKDHLIYGATNGYVYEISDSYANDDGTNFTVTITFPKEVFEDPYRLKVLQDAFVNFRNVTGTVNVSFITEGSDGLSTTAKSIAVSSSSSRSSVGGWGGVSWAGAFTEVPLRWGYNPSSGLTAAADYIKYVSLYKSGIRSVQIKITGTGADFELIGAKVVAAFMGARNVPGTWRT